MPLNLASPGIVVREVDLTSGRVDPTSDKSAGIVAPFAKREEFRCFFWTGDGKTRRKKTPRTVHGASVYKTASYRFVQKCPAAN